MPSPEITIELLGVTRLYRLGGGEVHALDGVSLVVRRGEFVAIMGSSGSGKSTLMNVLGCLDRPSSGRYLFEGVDVASLDEPALARIRSERIGFVFQSFNLLARTTAIENVALPLFYASSGPPSRTARMARALDTLNLMGLSDRAANTPAQLSGGEQQRVAIARALINEPSVLMADEPTGNLDTKTSHEIMATLRRLNRERGVTIIVVTHEADIAAYADRVVTMRDGKILLDEQNRSPTEIAEPEPPSSPATATTPLTPERMPRPWGFGLMVLGAAAQAIARNKLRSCLTMLGVFIGVAALIAMVAVGQGANQAVQKQLQSLGTNMVVVVPGAVTANGVRAGFGSASTLTVADALAIKREGPAISQVSYLIRQLGQVQYGNQNWMTNIQGVTPNYIETANWQIGAGRSFVIDDDTDAASICLIGQTVDRQLFGEYENPLGASILVRGVQLRVVGVLAAKGQTPFGQDQDDLVMVPFRTAERKVLGVAAPSQQQSVLAAAYPPPPNPYGLTPRMTGYVNQIFVQAVSQGLVAASIDQVTQTLLRRHHIRTGATKDFDVRNLSQIASAAEGSSRIMALLLATVASISLVVGGIGIMNILLVSVTERTREIGLRMAIGARRIHVLLQFLAEAVFLSLSGGVAGIVIGVALSWGISIVFNWPTPVSLIAIAGGFLFAAAVGIFFGYYPAHKAAHLNPIEALRYE